MMCCLRFIIGMSSDKDVLNCIKIMVQSKFRIEAKDIFCVEAIHPRAVNRIQLQDMKTRV